MNCLLGAGSFGPTGPEAKNNVINGCLLFWFLRAKKCFYKINHCSPLKTSDQPFFETTFGIVLTFISLRNTFSQRHTMEIIDIVLQRAFQYTIQNL